MLLISLATFLLYAFILPETGGEHGGRLFHSLYHAMVLLVAASPCAVVIATPAATLAGIMRAAQSGVLFKAGAHLERLADITTLAIDKTGTITEGKPRVVAVLGWNGTSAERVLELAASAEQHSEHVFAQAILAEARARNVKILPSTGFDSHTGQGVHAHMGDMFVGIGTRKLFDEHAVTVPAEVLELASKELALGHSAMIVGNTQNEFGVVSMADVVRPETTDVLRRLRTYGVTHVVILTGDHDHVAQAVAKEVGADAVCASLLPEQKVTEVARASKQFGPTAMLGDGVNDAPALAAADLGLAMGGAGTDVALETADVVPMKNDLRGLVTAFWIAQRTRAAIRRGLLFAFTVISVLVLSSLFHILPLWAAVIGHEGSTVCTIFSGLWLLFEKAPALPSISPLSGSTGSRRNPHISICGASAETLPGP